MSFYYCKPKVPRRGKNKLPRRGRRGRRLSLLREFEVGKIYTFPEFWDVDLPADYGLDENNGSYAQN